MAWPPRITLFRVALLAAALPGTLLAQTTTGSDVAYAFDSDVIGPKLLHKESPTYSDLAQSAGVQGDVLILVTVDITGSARDPVVLSPLGYGLDENALRCIAQWRFLPAHRNGRPINCRATIAISFRIAGLPFDALAEKRRVGAKSVVTLLSMKEGGRPTDDSRRLLKHFANEGWEAAEYVVGLWQIQGDVLPRDESGGIRNLRRAADAGYRPAMIFIGDALIDGRYMSRDVKAGLTYLRRAARSESVDAEQDLGTRFMNGQGLDPNATEARKYFELCAKAGRSECQSALGRLRN